MHSPCCEESIMMVSGERKERQMKKFTDKVPKLLSKPTDILTEEEKCEE